jgi:hypothetical protein
MRVLTADAKGAGDSIAAIFHAASPAVAAVTSISPASACDVATERSLRYAVQCWDDPEAGKAIFWKPGIVLQGLYRTEFQTRDGLAAAVPSGLLRVTLLWDGHPLHVSCGQLSSIVEDGEWQLAQVAAELDDVQGAAVLAIDPAGARLPQWPGYADAWSSARWRSIAYPDPFDVADAARASFGVSTETSGASISDAAAWLRGGPVKMFCSEHFSVVRARHYPWPHSSGGSGPLVADLTARAGGGENGSEAYSTGRELGRTGTDDAE